MNVVCEIMLSVSDEKKVVCVHACARMCVKYIFCILQNVEVQGIQTVENVWGNALF